MTAAREVIGQDHARRMLARAVSGNRLAHALLFVGPDGMGKGALARSLARAVNCDTPESRSSVGGCGHCLSCRQVDNGAHPDLREIAPHPRLIRIDQVREMIRESYLHPAHRYRVFLLKEVDRLTEEAANALLKVLEDPPARVLFLLTTARAGAVLPTIHSRCQVVPLRPVPRDQLAAHLQNTEGLPAEEAQSLALLSGGNPGWARTLAASGSLAEAGDLIARVIGLIEADRMDPSQVSALAAELESFRLEEQEMEKGPGILEFLSWAWRDLLIKAVGAGSQPVLLTLRSRSGPWPAPARILDGLAEMEKARLALERNAPRRLVFEVLLIKLHGQWQKR